MASPIPLSLDYTDKDFDSLHARSRNLLRSVFPKWTEESIANFGNILVGLGPHVGDVLGFYLDKWARESRIVTAELRRSLLGLVKLIGFAPEGATAASATETFTLAAALAGTLTIPAGTNVRTVDVTTPIRYQLLADLVLLAGDTTADALVENSESRSDQFASDSVPNQSFTLSATPYLPGSSVVTAADGSYTLVDNFLDSTSTDRHYTLSVDENDRAKIVFGNGVNGSIPQGTIDTSYKTGGGADGSVEQGALTILEGGPYSDDLGNLAVITVDNAEESSPGTDRQTNAQIKQLAPTSLRVLNRAIAREDFELVADLVSGVARSLMLFKDDEPAIAENAGNLFIVSTGATGVPSQALLDEVKSRFQPITGFDEPSHPRGNTLNLTVQAAPFQAIVVRVTAYKASGVQPATMKADIETALTNFFAVRVPASTILAESPELAAELGITAADGDALVKNPRINFGFAVKDADGEATGELPWSDIFNVIRDLGSVRKIAATGSGLLLNGQQADVTIGNFSFPQLSTVTIIDGDTGLTL